MKILLLDNYDSFTFNLYHYLSSLKCKVDVVRNDKINSREILTNEKKLKLTEKEINIITYLSQAKKPVSVNELEKKVWSYQSGIETHTVETHIYRLRKKIFNAFNDNELILSKKNGYKIK